MGTQITFDELRQIKHDLPHGSIRRIAERLDLSVDTVRNYFGGTNFDKGDSTGFHHEPGPNGGIVVLDDTTILDMAKEILAEQKGEQGGSCSAC